MSHPLIIDRRGLVVALGAAALTACGRKGQAPEPAAEVGNDAGEDPANAEANGQVPVLSPAPGARGSLEWAVKGTWREDPSRDEWRHPVETLGFFGLKPGMTVIEMWPGAGWYTEILAPYLTATGGKLYAANFTPAPGDAAAAQVVEGYAARVKQRKDLYGGVTLTSFGPKSAALAPAASSDLVLFLQTLHLWMAAGLAEKAFHDAFAALKPGGVLGIEEPRQPAGGAQDPLAAGGYVQEAYVRQLAEEAGFRFDAASELNANPKDTHDHPFGAATLPPERRSSPAGKPPDPAFDHAKYDAIGAADRMTLRFRKP